MSISSVLSPTALASQVLQGSPAVAAASTAGSFINTLLQTLQQAGTGAPSGAAANSGIAAATAAGKSSMQSAAALQALGHHHGHRAASLTQLALQSLQAGAATTPGRLLNTAA